MPAFCARLQRHSSRSRVGRAVQCLRSPSSAVLAVLLAAATFAQLTSTPVVAADSSNGYTAALETRLIAELRRSWQAAEGPRRENIVLRYLCDPLPIIRKLGLDLVEEQGTEGKPPSEVVACTVRELLQDTAPIVQAAAVRVVITFRNHSDAQVFKDLLERTYDRDVRAALLNGLGYLGEADAALALLAELDDNATASVCRLAAVNGLGRLAERGALSAALRDQAQSALMCEWQAQSSTNGRDALRERTLWALGRVGDAALAPFFLEALASSHATPIRQAALAAVSGWDSAEVQTGLIAACADHEPAIRRAALEVLSRRPNSTAAYSVLWQAAIQEPQTHAYERHVGWAGVVKYLNGRSWPEIREAMRKLPTLDSATAARCEELAGLALGSAPQDNQGWRHEVRRVQAQVCRSAGAASAAVRAYLIGISEYGEADAPEKSDLALEMLHFALRSGQYASEVHTALLGALTGDQAWRSIWTALETLQVENPNLCLAACQAVESAADGEPPEAVERLQALMTQLAEAANVQHDSPDSQPAAQKEADWMDVGVPGRAALGGPTLF